MFKNEAKEKKWILKSDNCPDVEKAVAEISGELGINPIIARLLYNRGFTSAEAAKSFLYMESEMLCNPFDMKDMDKTVERISRALKNREKITIYGDYDVDGVTAVCTLYLYLKSLGADVSYYIPNRAGEGYGVSVSAIDSIKEGGTSLIITVDTGITANEEVEYARSIGVDFLITDHHECRSELPSAVAVINPHRPDCDYPFKELAGVGVVFKLICAYEERIVGKRRIDAAASIFSKYADLVAIGTIADVMPVKSENRIIVSYGLKMIETQPRLGILALMNASEARPDGSGQERRKRTNKITSGYIGYTLAPRINAAGRIKTASMAVELFLADDKDSAYRIAESLCKANKERQSEENKIINEAYAKIEGLDIDKSPVIVLDADTWHHGVIGIVSSRITEKYCRPSILVSFEGNSDDVISTKEAVGKGSGRSIKGLNLVDALCYCNDLLVKFGGHELAAGLSVTRENLNAFKEKINEYALKMLDSFDMTPTIDVDAEIKFSDINLPLAEQVRILEPFGVANPIPSFAVSEVAVAEVAGISNNKHTKLTLTNGKSSVVAMYFSNSPDSLGIYAGDIVDVLFNIDINEWCGRRSVQLIVRDIRTSRSQRNLYERQRARFDEIRGGAVFYAYEDVLPSREDFVSVYKYIINSVRNGVDTLLHRDMCVKISRGDVYIGYIKLKFIIMVLRELNIVKIDEIADEVYRFETHYSTNKTDLDKSGILRKLRLQMARE